MEARLATSVIATALMRKAEAEGGFAAVIHKGDAMAGSILLILAERGRKSALLERILQADGRYIWNETGPKEAGNDEESRKFLDRRRQYDPDMWILELDVPSAERFTAEMNALD
jgi:hypothetical protein